VLRHEVSLEESREREGVLIQNLTVATQQKVDLESHHQERMHEKETEMMQLLEKRSREYAENTQVLQRNVEREMDSLERERREMKVQRQHDLDVLQARMDREIIVANERQQEELLKERRLFEATKIQLMHQRDVLHRKLGETLDAEQDAKEREGHVVSMNADNQSTMGELQNVIKGLHEMQQQNTAVMQSQQRDVIKGQEHLTQCTEQLLLAERREKAQREHFILVGKDNHATIKNLTDDLRFLIKQREEDYLNLLQQNQINGEAWKRNNGMLSEQLQTMRSDVVVQLIAISKRLGKSRISAQYLKPGTSAGKQTSGGRMPGTHVQRASIVAGASSGGGGNNRVDGITQQDLDDLRTDLEEQANVAAALQTLIDHNTQLQNTVQEWQDKATTASALANQVALALQGQANRKSASAGQERANSLKTKLRVLNPTLTLLDDGVAVYKEKATTSRPHSQRLSRDLVVGD